MDNSNYTLVYYGFSFQTPTTRFWRGFRWRCERRLPIDYVWGG